MSAPVSVRTRRQRISGAALALPLAIASFAWASPALAADPDPAPAADEQEVEIVVTAERRETSLLKTPLAVSAVTSDTLQSDRIETLADLAGHVPGLNLPNSYANMQSVFIRGIGTTDPGVPAAVGIYVDDVYIPRTFGNALFDLPDIERIEVLRGPQGTLYGQNTSGGAIKIVSRDPGGKLTGSIFAEYGNFNSFRTQAYLAAPIVDGLLSGSIAVTHRQRDGYTFNANTGRWVDSLNTDQVRAKLKLTPAPGFTAVLSADATFDDSDNALGIPLNYGTPDPRRTYANTDTRLNRDGRGLTLHLTGELSPAITLKSITGYRTVKDDPSPWDWDGTPEDRFGWSQTLESRQFSQEFQLLGDHGPLTYTLGAVYQNEKFDFDRFAWRSSAYSEIESHLKVESWGVYGQFNYNITDALRVTAGLRYGKEKQSFTNLSYRNNASGARTSLIYSVSGLTDTQDGLTPKLAVDYTFSPNLMAYASFTRGSKSGGFNRAAGTAQIASIAVSPESVTAYEFGLKGRTANRVLQGSVSAFYNDFKDYQAGITNPTIGGVLINGQVVVNAGAAHTYGIEAEVTFAPVDAVRWSASGAWLETRFDSFANPTGAAASDFTGNRLPLAPRFTLGSRLEVTVPLGIPGDVTATANVDYKSANFLDSANTAATQLKAQAYVDLGLSYRTADKHWTFQLLARNLFDKTEIVGPHFLTPSIGVDVVGYSQPRSVTVSARFAF
ncbi:TonB-dependent receptor [Sphingomonas sp. G-3-2-10]|uniref:TonB-dependent receptor n=1 Tax=Sphingomonas sp. G-3-2-10 TaxID=2728838 RepID=UPI00146DA369|nr:TonB-dependent receptor [Sphingomonas sp. G-3-2-10]NML05885.1 TonB-dependent receptor [Sphingomonas sp. G-3-2-10]